ncbi:MAG: 4-hydroxy-tetrahydrodipicolinate synthase [Kiritimatiellae bacterium]|nr:4-hydroxy-tetrahydrodipicolinate synthase [Kiritimatiellia bacterium]
MLSGTFTALITPFNQDGTVDFKALNDLVEWQVENGVEGISPVGTTGESPTLTPKEHLEVIKATVETAAGRVKIIAGTGSNSTAEALEFTAEAKELGVDATLQVTPYYNKPNAEGLYRHFSKVAELGVPVVLYNVPGRSGKEIPLDVVARLSANPMIAAIKEAAGSVERVSAIRNLCDLTVLSGDDSLALPMISVGASGVISVASNLIPKTMSDFIRTALVGDMPAAREQHRKLYQLFHDLFIDTNPIPAKIGLALMKRIQPVFRLPLCEPSEAVTAQLTKTMKALNLI